MTPKIASALTPLLRKLDPERAHNLALLALRARLVGRASSSDDPILATEVSGMHFSNPVGLAAGFDKNGVADESLGALGFGFVETGTVTIRPQPGNPRPRLFRLDEDRAIVNRFGFNNAGLDAYLKRLSALPRKRTYRVGANVGLNKEGGCAEKDYPTLVEAVAPYVDYIVINVSSPNTPGLVALQHETRLRAILDAVASHVTQRPPLLIKVSPDLPDAELQGVVMTAKNAGVDGLIVSNTTTARPASLRSRHAQESGGLSGAPLFDRSTEMLALARRFAGPDFALIGVGGIFTGKQALAKLRAGANLVQIYTSFIFEGPAVIERIKNELAVELRILEGASRFQQHALQ